ncbi:hypothetical protein JCM10207_000423 [Rhodosporidiobolus poonsookiae]
MPASLLRRSSTTRTDNLAMYDSPTTTASSSRPPAMTDFPSTYRVGSQQVLLVQVKQVKAHLKLLAAFHQLRQEVEAVRSPWTAHLEPKARWALFLHVAVQRLELYLDACIGENHVEWPTPPLDACLVLHSYLLNPGRYEEDAMRLHNGHKLRIIKQGFLTGVTKALDEGVYGKNYSGNTASPWVTRTRAIFDPLLNFSLESKATFVDPRTGNKISVNWLELRGKGYAQQGFEHLDLATGEIWTHEKLGIARLYSDIMSPSTYLAGTISSAGQLPSHPASSPRASYVRSALSHQHAVQKAASVFQFGSKLGWRKGPASEFLRSALWPKAKHGITPILAHYPRGERFSLDLVMAVLRQGTFIDKRCVARYHAFLDLLSSTPSMFCVPTLDIDLAWHTHQLTEHYTRDMQLNVGRFLDHDDKVEENALATAFNDTARAWQSRFGVPYSTCGCPPPSEPPLLRFGKLTISPPSPSTAPYTPSPLVPHPAVLDGTAATHASEHNALVRPTVSEAHRRRETHEAAFFAPYAYMPIYGPLGYPVPAGGCCSYEANHTGPPSSRHSSSCGGGGYVALPL